jgi:hypothetical protein
MSTSVGATILYLSPEIHLFCVAPQKQLKITDIDKFAHDHVAINSLACALAIRQRQFVQLIHLVRANIDGELLRIHSLLNRS